MSATQILEDLKSGKYSVDEAQTLLAQLKMKDLKKLTYKVSTKGAISFYGLRRMPITLYAEELHQIVEAANSPEFKTFLTENHAKLSTKEEKDD